MNRRELLKLTVKSSVAVSAAAGLSPLIVSQLSQYAISPAKAIADLPLNKKLYGISSYGDLKYPADFTHFDYVNPDAPKGGKIVTSGMQYYYNQNPSIFDTLNGFILKGNGPIGSYFQFDSLLTSAADEASSLYGLLAREFEITDNGNVWRFYLHSQARFHDDTPVKASDVAFSFNLLKEKAHPSLKRYFKEVNSVTAEADDVVTITFSGKQVATDPFLIATAAIVMPEHTFGENRDFAAPTFEPLIGSGAYKIGDFKTGKYIEYHRIKNYWGENLPVQKGMNNFDIIRFELFRDPNASFAAFTKGLVTFRLEVSAKPWVNDYNFEAIKDGRVKKFTMAKDPSPYIYGLFFNMRRPKFADIRVRKALNLSFDFNWTNKNIFFDQYSRLTSPFADPDIAARGTPSDAELALLSPYRDQLPPEVFGEPVMPPVSDGSGQDRELLRQARELLLAAGCKYQGSQLHLPDGQPFIIDYILPDPGFEKILTGWSANLKRIGIRLDVRLVDAAQFKLRRSGFDYDMTALAIGYGTYPGKSSLEGIFGSASAQRPGSFNTSGLSLPVVDRLIDALGDAKTKPEAATALSALDRVIRALRIYIPAWGNDVYRVGIWDMYDYPGNPPKYGSSGTLLSIWWYNKQKAKKIGMAE